MKIKKFTFLKNHWSGAATKVEAFLDRAPDNAVCAVYWVGEKRPAYRAANKDGVFPSDLEPTTVIKKRKQR